jgi:hypothetical protein
MTYKIEVTLGGKSFFMKEDDIDIEFEQKRQAIEFKEALRGIYNNLLHCHIDIKEV